MVKANKSGSIIGAGLLSAMGASLCCIAPLISLLAGSSIMITNFAWLEPARPYLISLSILFILFAWIQKFKVVKIITDSNCSCDTKRNSFWQSKSFLGILTVFAVLMMTFPLYAGSFFPNSQQPVQVAQINHVKTAVFTVKGMSCEACENHVNSEAVKLKGVVGVKTSYAKGTTIVKFNDKQTTVENIQDGIAKSGYKIVSFNMIK